VTTPLGSIYRTDVIFKNHAVNMEGRMLPTDLVHLEIQGCDVILGMNWVAKHKVTIDC